MTTRKQKKKIDKYRTQWKDHNVWLKSIGLPAESFEIYVQKRQGKYKPKLRGVKAPAPYKSSTAHIPSGDSYGKVGGTKKPENKYTGDKLMGIATMHKSNMDQSKEFSMQFNLTTSL